MLSPIDDAIKKFEKGKYYCVDGLRLKPGNNIPSRMIGKIFYIEGFSIRFVDQTVQSEFENSEIQIHPEQCRIAHYKNK